MSDSFTRDVIAASVDAAATEMFEILRKTAMSPIIYEVLDVGTGITDAKAALISSGAGIPSFVGVLDKSVAAILAKFGDTIREGDVFLTNDPNYGGVTHLNDVVVAEPVFWDNECVAWVASIAHWSDVGGATPGSMSTETTDIAAEGLRLPMVRLFDKGCRNEAVFDIITCNSRLPDIAKGDLWAQVSAGRRARKIIRALCQRHGLESVRHAFAEALELGEKRAHSGLSTLPRGTFSVAEKQDDGTEWTATITITDQCFTVDLHDAPTQSTGPYNTGRDGCLVACQVFFKALTDPQRFANAGSFAPLKVLTREGSVFHADAFAPHAYYFETRIKLIDMLWHCLADAIPERLPAGHFASIFGTVIAGYHPDTNRRYTMVEPQMGGWGATSDRPGQNALFSTNHGDTFNCPIEIAEARYGIEVLEKRLTFGPELSGEHSGGAGVFIRYQLRNSAVLSTGYSHGIVPVWSLKGARSGGVNQLSVHTAQGVSVTYRAASGVQLKTGDIVEISTAVGGSAMAE